MLENLLASDVTKHYAVFERRVEFDRNPARSAQIHRGKAEVDLSRPKWISVLKFTEVDLDNQR